jgi:hypothetical protein
MLGLTIADFDHFREPGVSLTIYTVDSWWVSLDLHCLVSVGTWDSLDIAIFPKKIMKKCDYGTNLLSNTTGEINIYDLFFVETSKSARIFELSLFFIKLLIKNWKKEWKILYRTYACDS